MRIDFNILWVEDQVNNVRSQRERISYLLREDGFRLQTEFAKSIEEAKARLNDDIFGDHIDLILMDFDLGSGLKGDEGLVQVRKKFPYKDIVFYSANPTDLLKLVADQRIQGVFCSTRNELPDKVYGVFESLVKKVLDIDHSRGIIMGATSEIDGLVNDSLSLSFENGDISFRKLMLSIVAEKTKKIRGRFENNVKKVEAAIHVKDIFAYYDIYTATDRINLLRKSLETNKQFTSQCGSMKEYVEKVVPNRNTLAHSRVVRDGFSRKLIDKNGNEWTSEKVTSLRLALLKHQEMLEELVSDYKGNAPQQDIELK